MADVREYLLGEIYSFATRASHKLDAALSGRYAALKIIGINKGFVCAALLDGAFSAPPSLADVTTLGVLPQLRFSFNGAPAIVRTPIGWENALDQFQYLGMSVVSGVETELAAKANSIGAWNSASVYAEGEWRWRHDRLAYEAEIERDRAEARAKVEAARNRIKAATFERLLSETQFTRWDPSPPYPPPEFVAQARVRIRQAVADIQMHGAEPQEDDVREVLKQVVEWFNAKDAEFGGVIETEEREDICDVLEEICHATKHPDLIEEIETWRDW
jgi:hypothetical protein